MNRHVSSAELLEIRRRAASAGSFPGYRPGPVLVSGAVGLTAGATQLWLQPGHAGFVGLWIAAAIAGFGYNLLCISRIYGASPRRWERSLAYAALTDLLPSVLAASVLTLVFLAQGHVELLPGVWMVLFGMGILSSRRHLPTTGLLMGGMYLLAGTVTLVFLPGEFALRAEVMAGVFGLGQFVVAGALKEDVS